MYNSYMNTPLFKEIFKRGYTISAFCEVAKIDRTTLYKYFQGQIKNLSGSTIYNISETLKIPYEKVLDLCKESL